MNRILDKTDKGRDEIATRKHGLPPRMRTLLVLIDGKHTEEALLKQVAGIGMSEQNVNELIEAGFVAAREVPAAPASPAAKQPAPPPVPARAAVPQDAMAAAIVDGILLPGESQFQALYRFYNATIKESVGLRGYGLTLKVERAESIDDFRALRTPYLEAVTRAKGDDTAALLARQLDMLLSLDGQTAEAAA